MSEPSPAATRRRAFTACPLLACSLLVSLGPGAASAATLARTVSPGALDRTPAAVSPCPTFSWAGVDGAAGYELVVMALVEGGEPRVVLRSAIEGSASSFTPDRTACLPPGAYAWTVRATGGPPEPSGDGWAPARRFAVPDLPSAAELEAALDTLRRWQAGQAAGTFPGPSGQSAGTFPEGARPAPVTRAAEANVSGTAAIRGEMPGGSGETYGVAGVSASPQGAGLAAVNTGGGADLVLDGAAQSETDARLFHDAFDRPSSSPETFDFRNSGAGTITLQVDGVDVVTTATDQDTLGGLACTAGEIAKQTPGGWQCATDDGSSYAAGNQLQLTSGTFDVLEGTGSGLDADTVDGLEPSQIASLGHDHFGQTWSGSAPVGLSVVNGVGEVGTAISGSLTSALVTGAGVEGSVVSGTGVVGWAFATSGESYGVWGKNFSAAGAGVRGASSTSTGAAPGVWGSTQSAVGSGVLGEATAAAGEAAGVLGIAGSPAAAGVRGTAPNLGVVGEASVAFGSGVKGIARNATGHDGWGVFGDGPTGVRGLGGVAGVRGTGQYGVMGETDRLDGVGVWGSDGGFGGEAGRFLGNVAVAGALTKWSGSFKIDHPLDPENKYLYHSFVESPDMMNIYNGNVTLDERRRGLVELPAWFEALNREFRYQLTPLGGWSACWIGRQVEGNRFLIRGGPRAEVSWQVTGIRHDRWAEAHRIPVEEEKPPAERGRYLAPEVWGQPRERATGWPLIAATVEALERQDPAAADPSEVEAHEAP